MILDDNEGRRNEGRSNEGRSQTVTGRRGRMLMFERKRHEELTYKAFQQHISGRQLVEAGRMWTGAEPPEVSHHGVACDSKDLIVVDSDEASRLMAVCYD